MIYNYNDSILSLEGYEEKITNIYPKHISFCNAVIYFLADCIFKTDEDALNYLLDNHENYVSYISNIVTFIEMYSHEKTLTTYNNQKTEVDFKKFNPKANTLPFLNNDTANKPLFFIYKNYYYDLSELHLHKNDFKKIATAYYFPKCFKSEVADFISMFILDEESFKKYNKKSEEKIKNNIIQTFAKNNNIKISNSVIEAIICFLDGKLVRSGGRKRIRKKPSQKK